MFLIPSKQQKSEKKLEAEEESEKASVEVFESVESRFTLRNKQTFLFLLLLDLTKRPLGHNDLVLPLSESTSLAVDLAGYI